METMNKTTINPAAIGIGAAVSVSTTRDSDRAETCSQNAHSAAMANNAKNTVLTVTPPNCGTELLYGTPKFETYHQPFVDAKDMASRKNTSERKAIRFRADRSTSGDISTVASAAIAAPTAANRPKW